MQEFLDRVKWLTALDLQKNTIQDLFTHTAEELGELAGAMTIEKGVKKKPLTESAKWEAVDLTICALAMFYAHGGTDEELREMGLTKLLKWEKRLD